MHNQGRCGMSANETTLHPRSSKSQLHVVKSKPLMVKEWLSTFKCCFKVDFSILIVTSFLSFIET